MTSCRDATGVPGQQGRLSSLEPTTPAANGVIRGPGPASGPEGPTAEIPTSTSPTPDSGTFYWAALHGIQQGSAAASRASSHAPGEGWRVVTAPVPDLYLTVPDLYLTLPPVPDLYLTCT